MAMKNALAIAAWCVGVMFFDAAEALTINIITNNTVADSSFRLMEASPYDREEVTASPKAVSLTFSRPARVDKGYIKVLDTYGTRLDSGTLEAKGDVLSAALPDLVPGRYTVKWSADCACEDDANPEGIFHFTVR